jgi:hypothetical protein
MLSTMNSLRPPALLLLFGCLLLACCSVTSKRTGVEMAPIEEGEVRALLLAQTDLWNEGDLPGFVDTYWDGDELTFFGRSGLTRGRTDLLANYQRGYPTKESRGVLSFDVLEFRPLGGNHALLLGSYHLQRDDPAHGVFSLVLTRQAGRIVILHDHSTATGE